MTKINAFIRSCIWLLIALTTSVSPLFVIRAAGQTGSFGIQFDFTENSPGELAFQLGPVGQWPANFDLVRLLNDSGDYQVHKTGTPELPFYTRLVEIPENAIARHIILVDEIIKFSPPSNLRWGDQVIPLVDDLVPGQYQDASSESGEGFGVFPERPVVITDDTWVGNKRFLKLEVYPFQFDYTSKVLLWHKRLSGKVFIEQQSGELKNFSGSSGDSDAFEATNLPLEVEPGTRRIKIVTDIDGIYQVKPSDLASLGLVSLNPDLFKLTSQGLDIAFYILNDNGNDLFDADESLIFLGEGFDGEYMASIYADENQNWFSFTRQKPDGSYETWKPEFNKIMLEKYTDQNVYWLSWDGESGLRMETISGEPRNLLPDPYHRESIRIEENRVWRTFPFTSEDTWFLERIQSDIETTRTYPFTINFPFQNGGQAVLRGSVMAAKTYESTSPDHHIKVFINEQTATFGDFTWDGKSRLIFEFAFPTSYLNHGDNQLKLVVIPTASIPQEDLFVDWFELAYDREYQAIGNQLDNETKNIEAKEYLVKGFSNTDLLLLDDKNRREPKLLSGWVIQEGSTPGMSDVRFNGSSGSYFVAAKTAVKTPNSMSVYVSPDYLSEGVIDYAFITSTDLISATTDLAAYRSGSGFQTAVVDFNNLINDFNYGIYHPIAIKNYFRFLLKSQGQLPRYSLLVGDGHWNFHRSPNYSSVPIQIPPNLVWVDPWQGEVDSANLLATIIGNDPLADLTIARLPVNTSDEVLDYLDKLMIFDNTKPATWRNMHVFIADNPDDAGNFYNYANTLINSYVVTEPGMSAKRVFLENNSIQTSQEIIDLLNGNGAQLVNYIGHGRINGWAAESILQNSDIERLNNPSHPPVIVSMTCLDGYWIHPNQPGLIEELVRNSNGAVAAFSPTGLGVSTGHDIMHKAFYQSVLSERDDSFGSAVEAAKLALYQANSDFDLLHTYTIFGDPSLKFHFNWTVFIPTVYRGY